MRKLILMIASVFIALIGLLMNNISHADRPTEEDQTILTVQSTIASTVKITPPLSRGSGFYISPNRVLTNWHVVSMADTVRFTKSTGEQCTGEVGYRDERLDLAILTTSCAGVPLHFGKNPVVGTTIMSVGNPDQFDFVVSKGISSGYYADYLMFDARVNYGNSGGPLVDASGDVVGIVTAKAKDDQWIGFAVPVEAVQRFMERVP